MMAAKRAMVTAAGVMVMATNECKGSKGEGHGNKGVEQGTCWAKDCNVNEDGNGNSNEGGG